MYGRDYEGKSVHFEASGGLVHSSLVMQDRETDTYWSIMDGKAVAGELEGNALVELPVGKKVQWRHWKREHPETLVLSVDGLEDAPNAYQEYFRSPRGFGDEEATDDRLATKEPVFAFHRDGVPYAARHEDLEDGRVFVLGSGEHVLLYRQKGSSMFQSTEAFVSAVGFDKHGDGWVEKGTGFLVSTTSIARVAGFDTFWYTFSLNNPDTKLLQ